MKLLLDLLGIVEMVENMDMEGNVIMVDSIDKDIVDNMVKVIMLNRKDKIEMLGGNIGPNQTDLMGLNWPQLHLIDTDLPHFDWLATNTLSFAH